LLAEQDALVPPLLPAHVQFQGPLPVMAVAVPPAQKLVSGATVEVTLLLVPQAPFTDTSGFSEKVAVTVQLPVMAAVV
jgi:hypothetical protein